LDKDAAVGLYENISALEAEEDLRFALVIGAVFGGKDGQDYLNNLTDIAFSGMPTEAEAMHEMIEASSKTRPHSSPEMPPGKVKTYGDK